MLNQFLRIYLCKCEKTGQQLCFYITCVDFVSFYAKNIVPCQKHMSAGSVDEVNFGMNFKSEASVHLSKSHFCMNIIWLCYNIML